MSLFFCEFFQYCLRLRVENSDRKSLKLHANTMIHRKKIIGAGTKILNKTQTQTAVCYAQVTKRLVSKFNCTS